MNEKYFLVSKYPDDVNPTDIAFEPVAKEKVPDDFLSFKTDIEKVLKTINVLYENEVQKKKSLIEQVFFAAQVCYSGSESDYAI
ncbi:hypothetical protein SMZ17_004216, partial [Cronobacter turicensis]|nr:hypothetical protein [Cronobacter turicensis]